MLPQTQNPNTIKPQQKSTMAHFHPSDLYVIAHIEEDLNGRPNVVAVLGQIENSTQMTTRVYYAHVFTDHDEASEFCKGNKAEVVSLETAMVDIERTKVLKAIKG